MFWSKIYRKSVFHLPYFPGSVFVKKIKYFNKQLFILGSLVNYSPVLIITDSVREIRSYRDYWTLNNPMFYNYDKLLFDIQVNDSNIFMCGQSNNFVVSLTYSLLLFKSWFLQTDTKGCLKPSCDSLDIRWNAVANNSASNKNIIEVSVYPNPTANVVQVYTNLNLFLLEVYNSQSQKL